MLATVLLMSITIKRRTIFDYVYSGLSHVTVPTQNLAESLFKDGYQSTESYSKKLFHNSVPRIKDSVKSKASAPGRGFSKPQETIHQDEKDQLDDLIKSHH